MKEEYNVLSEFDGMSCGQLALLRTGKKVNNYFSSETDKYAIHVAIKNFPNTKQLGDVTKIKINELPKINLFIGGSPCQGFSFSGKQLNFNDPRSRLFFEFAADLRFIQEFINKDVEFLLENVKMKKQYQDVISKFLGVEPIEINSNLVSAQNRTRLYWTNIKKISIPDDKNINLLDILEEDKYLVPGTIKWRYINKATIIGRRLNSRGRREDYNKNIPITQCLEVRNSNIKKSNCITTVDKDNVLTFLPPGRYPNAFSRKTDFRYYSIVEKSRLQTLPDYYIGNEISYSQASKMIGNGWTVDVIAHIFKNLK